jgi:hypothetical protein
LWLVTSERPAQAPQPGPELGVELLELSAQGLRVGAVRVRPRAVGLRQALGQRVATAAETGGVEPEVRVGRGLAGVLPRRPSCSS